VQLASLRQHEFRNYGRIHVIAARPSCTVPDDLLATFVEGST
jgi:hypothetical protein